MGQEVSIVFDPRLLVPIPRGIASKGQLKVSLIARYMTGGLPLSHGPCWTRRLLAMRPELRLSLARERQRHCFFKKYSLARLCDLFDQV